MSSLVQETLLTQRESWARISERVAKIPSHELPHETPKRILIFGLGSSHFAARLSGYALMRDKSRARIPVVACSSMNIGVDVIPTKGDWAFGISHRGTSKPTEAALDFCLRVGAFTVLVAGEDARKMESAQLTLTTVPQERVEPHTASMTGAICAITSLMMGLKGLEEWDALRSIGDPDLDQLRQKVGEGPSVLLGEFEGEWLAREGALKLMEMARLPVRVFGSEEFYHGPKFSHNFEKDSIWHILTPQDPRNDEIKPSYRITVTGMTPLAWIPALIQLQWMSLAVALNRGVNPDDPNL